MSDSITIQPVKPKHIPELAAICFNAFGKLHERHAVEADFDSIETANMVIGMLAASPEFAGFVAMVDGKIVGSNFVSFSDPVSGVGPITVDPACQARGVGRRLMQAVMDAAKERGVREVRLLQEAINSTSLSLYTKLGFDWREGIAMFRPVSSPEADRNVRAVTDADLPAIDAISIRHYGSTRINEVRGFMAMQMPGVLLERQGRPIGYFFPGMFGHGFAETEQDLAVLIGQSMRTAPPMFQKTLIPLGAHELHRALLSAGGKTIKQMNYMTFGPYTRPMGGWVPSIGM
ncbi:MAG: GNAT family N-acetyltransferase [Burkholderiales bacterium]|nr:GNAT family N-acetyltransferase [Phycisphaerae bacterium]